MSTLRRTTISNTLMCTLHDLLSSKIRFIHTSTVTGSHSCSEKKLRVRFAYILLKMHTYVGALSYADDITLLCPSIRGLNEMMYICCEYAEEYNIVSNIKKKLVTM